MNIWLRQREQAKWSDKLLTSRFGDHDEVSKHGVVQRKKRKGDGLSRPYPDAFRDPTPWGTGMRTLPDNPFWAWIGVRFRAQNEAGTDWGNTGCVPHVPSDSETPYTRESKKFEISWNTWNKQAYTRCIPASNLRDDMSRD
jgi:hypothetical protein